MPRYPVKGYSIAKMLGCPCHLCPRHSPDCRGSCVEYFKYELRKQKYYADRQLERSADVLETRKQVRTAWLRKQLKDSRR